MMKLKPGSAGSDEADRGGDRIPMHFDEAFEFLIQYLVSVLESGGRADQNWGSQRDHDLWISDLVWKYWFPRIDRQRYLTAGDLEPERYVPFYDAAWELCRLGVLRPGEAAPRGMNYPAKAFGDGYSITGFGRGWLKRANQRPIADPGRLAEVLQSFAPRFGGGYAQRATEAVATYRTMNYLAACVMSGAAAESILLALAIEKMADEAKVLAEYNTSGGRRRITNRVSGNVAPSLATQFQAALQVLHYWRDDAGHGTITTISEIEAHNSLTQLLRLAQFAFDHWDEFTRPNTPGCT
jgi:hypothetical protein